LPQQLLLSTRSPRVARNPRTMWHAMEGGSGETDGGESPIAYIQRRTLRLKHLPSKSRRSPSRDGSTRRKASLATLGAGNAGGLAPRARGSRPTVNGETPVRSKSPKPDPLPLRSRRDGAGSTPHRSKSGKVWRGIIAPMQERQPDPFFEQLKADVQKGIEAADRGELVDAPVLWEEIRLQIDEVERSTSR